MKTISRRRLLSLVLALSILAGALPLQALAEGPAGTGEPAAVPEEGIQSNNTVYYEVRFALPDEMKDLTADELEEVWLPDTQLVPSGTRIVSFPIAERLGYLFSGWYYDAALEQRWAQNDVVERNLTLYPHFIDLENADSALVNNFISDQDVAPDFPVLVAAYDLTEDEVRGLIAIRDLDEFGNEDMAYVLEQQETDPAELVADEEKRETIVAALRQWQREGGSLGEALREAGADDTTACTLQAHYAMDELRAEAETTVRGVLAEMGYGTGDPSENMTEQLRRISGNRNAMKVLTETLDMDGDAVAKAKPAELAALCTEAALRKGMQEAGLRVRTVYRVRPASGVWPEGHLSQIELVKTDSLRFLRNGVESSEYVIYYNLSAAFETFNNMRLRSGLTYIPLEQVDGVELNDGLFKSTQSEDEDLTVERNEAAGVLTSRTPVKPGDLLVIYDGELREDGSADRMGYYRITADLGDGQYAYEIPGFEDVVFIPDVIPVRSDGTYEDGVIIVSADQFDFTHPTLAEMGLTEDTVVEPGDWIALYNGSLDRPDEAELVGYGELTEVKPAENGLALRYTPRTEEDMTRLAGMAMRQENVPLNLTEEEMKEIEANAVKNFEENGFMDQAGDYVASLIFDDTPKEMETEEYRKAIQAVRFTTDDGEELTLEEVRKLNLITDRITETKHSPFHIRFTISLGLKHFSGTGARLELSASSSWRYNFKAVGEDTKDMGLTITILVQFEQEIAVGVDLKFDIQWKKYWFVKVPVDVKGSFTYQAGTFTAVGFEITIASKKSNPGAKQNTNEALIEENNKMQADWEADPSKQTGISDYDRYQWTGKLLNATSKLDGINAMLDQAFEGAGYDSQEKDQYAQLENPNRDNSNWGTRFAQNGTLGGGIEEKYASFVKSKAEYVPFWDTKILDKEFAPDPFHLCALGLVIKAHASVKLCVVFGASVSYGQCKRWTVKFKVLAGESESTAADTEAPNLNIGVYVFGMIGLRVGLILDFRIGLISTRLGSIGAVLEFGLYAEFYGFFYFGYKWEKGKGGEMQMLGTLLFEIGFYMNVKLKAQIGNDRKKVEKEVFSMKVPFISLGAQNVFLDFNIDQSSDKLSVEMKGSTAVMPETLYEMKALGVSSGSTDKISMDGKDRIPVKRAPVVSYGKEYMTYDEDFFEVTCVDTDKDGKSLGTCSWTYDPETNTVTARPKDDTVEEMWGEITFAFRNPPADMFKSYAHDKRFASYCNYGVGFAFSGNNLQRTVKVHWVRTTAPLTVRKFYQICPDTKVANRDQFVKATDADLSGWYLYGETVQLMVPAEVLSSLSVTDPALKARAGYTPVMVHSSRPVEIAPASSTAVSDVFTNGLWNANRGGGPKQCVWVDSPDKCIWQSVPKDGGVIDIYYNDTAGNAKHWGWDPVHENVEEATCTAAGSYDLVVRCKICDKVMSSEHKTEEKLPHTAGEAVRENEKEPTCTEKGSYDEVVYCTACKEELSRIAREIPAKGHVPGEPVREDEVEPNCTEKGSYDEVIYCTVCKEEVSRKTVAVDAKGHVPGETKKENEKDPTCMEKGSYDEAVYCTVCKAELSRKTVSVDAKGHVPGETKKENEKEPTCTEKGSYDEAVYCTVCEEELSRKTVSVDAKGHVPGETKRENEKEPTCTEKGSYDDVVYCTVCKAELSRKTVSVSAKGHVPGETVKENVKDPTCTEKGSYDNVVYCTVCGEELSRVGKTVPKLGHDWHVTQTDAEPIMKNGKCVGWKPASKVTACSRCEEKTVETYPVDTAPAMNDDSWTLKDGTLSAVCAYTGPWGDGTVTDFLGGAGFFGYAGTLGESDCFTVPGSFTADEGGDTAIKDHPNETLSVPVTFTPDDRETYAPCSFTLSLTVNATGVHYVDENEKDNVVYVYNDIAQMPADGTARGWYVVSENFTFDDRLVINGNVNLILGSGQTLECPKGIQLAGGSLTIWGQEITGGSLICNADSGNAAIGGGADGPMGGSLTVRSGYIRAISTGGAAGIGGGQGQDGGTVDIRGGFVQAGGMSNDCAAIGAGNGGSDHGQLTIGDQMMSENSAFTAETIHTEREKRVENCHRYAAAIIQICTHYDADFTFVDEDTHAFECAHCYSDTGTEAHVYDEEGRTCMRCGYYAFGTPDMSLPSGVTEVAESAFEGMPVTAVWLGDSCTAVGDYAFRNCTKLERIRLPKDCTLGEGVLDGCGAVVIMAPAGGTSETWAREWMNTHQDCWYTPEY